MQWMLSRRIRRWYVKLLYALAVFAPGYLLTAPLTSAGVPLAVLSIADSVVLLLGILYGARIFRGADEPDEPARPWWQMTARRTLSRVVGALALVGALVGAGALLGRNFLTSDSFASSFDRLLLADVASSTALYAILAFLYLNSAARLPKPGPRTPALKLTPTPKLK